MKALPIGNNFLSLLICAVFESDTELEGPAFPIHSDHAAIFIF